MADEHTDEKLTSAAQTASEDRNDWLMSGLKTAAVAVAFGLVGFAAVYLSLRGGANENKAETETASVKKAAQSTAAAAMTSAAALPQGPGRNKLSVGDMAMFVFKPKPMPLPELSFKNGAGKDITFADFKGRVILVNLWATWCAPCREEMPDLNALQKMLGSDKFEVVAISLDRGSDAKPRAFLKKVGADALSFYQEPTARIGAKLKTIGMPATLLIDAQGRELGRLVGPAKWAGQDAQKLIKAAIAAAK